MIRLFLLSQALLISLSSININVYSFDLNKDININSKTNIPIFYGATEITIDKDSVESFSIKDSRFRVFAKDYEDGDLTPYIQCTYNDVNPTIPGDYTLTYEVNDKDGNTVELNVPVHVKDETGGKFDIVRTIYSIPKMNNMSMTGMERCNKGDRQMLGVYLPANSSLSIKNIDTGFDSNMTVTCFTNTRAQNSILNIKSNNEYQYITNIRNSISYDCVPLLTSPRLSTEDIDKTFKIEIKYDNSVKPLDYYHYKDDEDQFKSGWNDSKNSFAVIDSEAIMFVAPFEDIDKLTNYGMTEKKKAFDTLDDALDYYLNVINRMDQMAGLVFDWSDETNRNYRTKYVAVADKGYAGAGAYYNGDFIAVANQTSISAFFSYGWGTLHELAHGYQGYFGRGVGGGVNLCFNETGNNVLAYYIQNDKSLYKDSANWLGDLSIKEDDFNKKRLNGQYIFQNDEGTYTNVNEKLYFLVNFFNSFEGEKTYGKLFSFYRSLAFKYGPTYFKVTDVYALFFLKEYKADILPYLDAWKLDVTPNVRRYVLSQDSNSYVILGDVLDTDELNSYKVINSTSLKYSLVDEDELNSYMNSDSSLSLKIEIDDDFLIIGKKIGIKKNGRLIETKVIESNFILFKGLKHGDYEIEFPAVIGYDSKEVESLYLKEGENTLFHSYTKIESLFYHQTKLGITGVYNTFGFTLTLSENNKKGTVSLGGANLGNQTDEWKNKPDSVFVSVTIKDLDDNVVKQWSVKGNEYFATSNVPSVSIDLEYGYKISIYTERPQYVNVYSVSLGSNNPIEAYRTTDKNIEYEVTEDGLNLLNYSDFDTKEVLYEVIKNTWIAELRNYQQDFDDETLSNKRLDLTEKNKVVQIYGYLKEDDRIEFDNLIKRIYCGGLPTITSSSKYYSISKGDDIDLYELISIFDSEDYQIESNSNNVSMNTSFDKDKVGTYNVEYTVKDSDGNESSYIITIEVKEKNQSNDSSNDDDHKNNGNDDKPDDYDIDKERVNRIIIVVSSIIGCIFIALVIVFEFFRIRKKNKNKH